MGQGGGGEREEPGGTGNEGKWGLQGGSACAG
jgi:hypothetical protein